MAGKRVVFGNAVVGPDIFVGAVGPWGLGWAAGGGGRAWAGRPQPLVQGHQAGLLRPIYLGGVGKGIHFSTTQADNHKGAKTPRFFCFVPSCLGGYPILGVSVVARRSR